MRRMSFALTTEAIKRRTKTVTRRLGWTFAKVGDRIQAVDKLRTKNAVKLAVIEITNVRRERLSEITPEDVTREGFEYCSREYFMTKFCVANGLDERVDDPTVTRIEFRYLEEARS